MPARIEDYALIGDCHTAALVSRDGSIDWLCLPRFDSGACFAALLGKAEHGRWLLAPAAGVRRVRHHYRDGTLVLETDYETDTGAVTVIDCMLPRQDAPHLIRIVHGRRGQVAMRSELILRFDYGSIVPWVRRVERGLHAVAGPDAVHVRTPVELRGENLTTVADFSVAAGQRVPFVFSWSLAHQPDPEILDPEQAITDTEQWWQQWSHGCRYTGDWQDAVQRSLITLKALTYLPTGGIVAAPTTSLPEQLRGVRNWDYRYCWLRDATFTLYALLQAGYHDEARAWREWLLRAAAGEPSRLQIMYGLAGERRLTELELDWLPGYEGAAPVRIGNGAFCQRQFDVYGEVVDLLHQARRTGLDQDHDSWQLQTALLDFLESAWEQPGSGMWEIRGPSQHFTHSKVMAWVAVDRAIKAAERFGLAGPVERWRRVRETIHAQVCRTGFDAERGIFVQAYDSKQLDASLLLLPLVGFLPATDSRVQRTVEAIERELIVDGFVSRYTSAAGVDGLPPGEGAFLACSFWLADNLVLLGRRADAQRLFERLLAVRNDVGLLAEEYDPRTKRQVGNFPQAFSHVALVNTAYNLTGSGGPAEHRCQS